MICSRTQGNPYTIERGMTIVLIRIESAINLRRLSKTSDLPPTYLCRFYMHKETGSYACWKAKEA